jgi:hypothetical protein
VSVRVVFDHPQRHVLRRMWRGVAAVVGGLLVVAALLATALMLLLLFALALTVSHDHRLPPLDVTVHRVLVVAGAVALAGLVLGLGLIRGQRRLLLFLRRFDHLASRTVVADAAVTALGRSWRVVTLTNGDANPSGAGRGVRRLSRAATLLGFLVVGGGLFWLLHGGLGRLFDRLANETRPTDPVKSQVGAAIGSGLVALLVVILVALAVASALAVLAVVALFGLVGLRGSGERRSRRRPR